MSYRRFMDFAKSVPSHTDSADSAQKEQKPAKGQSPEAETRKRQEAQLKEWFDSGREVHIVGVKTEGQWEKLRAELEKIAKKFNSPIEMRAAESAEDLPAA